MAVKQKFKMVQNDQMPEVWLSLTDNVTKAPVDVSDPGTVVYAYVREVSKTELKATLVLEKLTGVVISIDEETGAQTVSEQPPYNIPGRGGRVAIVWEADTLDRAGSFQVEISVVFFDARVLTWYDLLQFSVREEFA